MKQDIDSSSCHLLSPQPLTAKPHSQSSVGNDLIMHMKASGSRLELAGLMFAWHPVLSVYLNDSCLLHWGLMMVFTELGKVEN